MVLIATIEEDQMMVNHKIKGDVSMRNGEKYLSVFDAERLTGRKVSTWRRDILEKRIAFVKFGRSVRIPLSEIQRMVADGWQEANSK